MQYTAVIRTLGTAGEKYQKLLDSLVSQTLPPEEILVYIAEGYQIPSETVGAEKYIFVKKGMVAQRALRYDEVKTEYILFLDDDLYLPVDTLEKMFGLLVKYRADVVSPDIYPNSERPFKQRFMMAASGRMRARYNDRHWGYKVMRTAGYSYNAHPVKDAYWSQTNAGACFLCRKADFLSVHFEEELWMDRQRYPIGEDQVMYYKMYKSGLKELTAYNTGILHLDAGLNTSKEKERSLIYADFVYKTIFWHRFIYLPEKSVVMRLIDILCIGYAFGFALVISLIKGRFDIFRIKLDAMKEGRKFLKSEEYRKLPLII